MKPPAYPNQVRPQGLVDVEINTTTRPRIIGPDDQPINPPLWERVVAMALKNGWSQRKVKEAVTGIGVSLTTWLVAHDLPTAGLVVGITTALTGAYNIFVSYLCHRANVSAPTEFDPLQDTQAPIFIDPTPTLTNIAPLGLGEAIRQDRTFPSKSELAASEAMLESSHSIERVKPGMICISSISPGEDRWKRKYFAACNVLEAARLQSDLESWLPAGSWVDFSKGGESIPLQIPDFTQP